jgi:ribosomal protein S18 acetylase RimI-like enzyme
MEEGITVRRAKPEDADFLALMNDEFNEVRISPEQIAASLRSSNELVAIGLIDSQPAGFACAQYYKSFCYTELCGEITEVYVREHARRNGLATGMISFLEAELNAIGVGDLKILANVNNAAAVSAYEKCGYARDTVVMLDKQLSYRHTGV